MEFLEVIVTDTTGLVVLFIEAVVLVVITVATLLAVGRTLGLLSTPPSERTEQSRQIWLGYARWLVAGLTLQLGADILESSIAPTWHAIAQLGAIALIRTFATWAAMATSASAASDQPRATNWLFTPATILCARSGETSCGGWIQRNVL